MRRVALRALCRHGSRICGPSHFSIARPWRRASGFSLKDVLTALAVFLVSGTDVLAGTLRNNQGINKLAYRNGFRSLATNLIYDAVEVDLAALYRESCVRTPTSVVDEAVTQRLEARLERFSNWSPAMKAVLEHCVSDLSQRIDTFPCERRSAYSPTG